MEREKKFCKHCGYALKEKVTVLGYNEYTGDPLLGPITKECMNEWCRIKLAVNKYGR